MEFDPEAERYNFQIRRKDGQPNKRAKPKSASPASAKVLQVKADEAREKVLAYLAAGETIADSMARVGRSRLTFYNWCNTVPGYRERVERIRNKSVLAKSDFAAFRRKYFNFDTYDHQQKIIDAIEATPINEVTLILLPPGAGKTSVLEDRISQVLAEDPNHRFCVISEAQDHARKIIGRVARRMTDRNVAREYVDTFGPFKAPDRDNQKPWNADRLTVMAADHDERDPSLECKSIGSAIYGARYDTIIMDDVQSTKNLNATDRIVEYFRQDVVTRVISGRIIIVGTRVGPGDFYEFLMVEGLVRQVVLIPALDEDGNTYWPEAIGPDGRKVGWSNDALDQRRAIVGADVWARVYMQAPLSKRGAIFTPDMIERAKDNRVLTSGPPGLRTVGHIDPALGGHCVIRVSSFDYENFWLMDGTNQDKLQSYEEIFAIMEQLTRKWNPSVWVIEGNAFQKGLWRDERLQAMGRKYGFTIEQHLTGRNKGDSAIGVASMDGAFARGQIHIPWGDEEAKRCFGALPVQLERWRPDIPSRYLVQDEVMCLWFGFLHWHRMRETMASRIDAHLATRGLPYKATAYGYTRRPA